MRKLITLFAIIVPFLVSCKQEVYYEITTKVQPDGAGIIVLTPNSSQVLEGESVTLQANPNGDYIFTGWSGSISGTDNPKSVTVSSNLDIVANFTLKSYPLTVSVEGEGIVNERVISTKTEYGSGTVVELTAVPAEHWLFDHWEGDLEGKDNPAQITISGSKQVKAVFVSKDYELIINVKGRGKVVEKVIDTKTEYQEGTTVELTAESDEFWVFDHWEGELEGKDNPIHVTVTKATEITAVFVENDPGIVFTETESVSPAEIFERMGMGWTLGGHLESVWKGVAGEAFNDKEPITQPLFFKLREIGFKSIRIPISWIGQFGPAPDYLINEAWLDRIADYLDYCKAAGLNVIIDFHCDAWRNSDGYMNWEGEKYDMFWLDMAKACLSEEENVRLKGIIHSLWVQIARRFRDEGDYLIFQPFNEPSASPTIWGPNPSNEEASRILYEWNQTFVDAVRSTGGNNAKRWLLIPSINAQEITTTVNYLQLPKDYCSNNRLLVSAHCYEPYAFTHYGSEEWGHTAINTDASSIYYGEQYISSLFSSLNNRFISRGIPVVLDETGCRNKDTERGKRFQEYYIEYMCKCAHDNLIPSILYDFSVLSDRFAYIDHHTGEFRENGENVIAHMKKAVYNDDTDYTINTVYESAPFPYDQKEIQIPDDAFRRYLLDHYDLDNDGRIMTNEALSVTNIQVASLNISSLTGIESFPHLEYLNCEHNPGLTHLDVSTLPNLKYLIAQECNIDYFDVSHNPLLVTYQVNGNPFYRVPDLTHNLDLEGIHINTTAGAYYIPFDYFVSFPKIKSVSFGGYDKESIDFSKNVLLEDVWAFYLPNMEVLDLSHSPNLNYVYVPDCPKLKTIIVHPDVNLDNLVVVKGENTTVTHAN